MLASVILLGLVTIVPVPEVVPKKVRPAPVRFEVDRDVNGAVVRVRTPKPQGMTHCPNYSVIYEEEYICNNWAVPEQCGDFAHSATGGAMGEFAGDACNEAKTNACATVEYGCAYEHCDMLTDTVAVFIGEQGGLCFYTPFERCTDYVAPGCAN